MSETPGAEGQQTAETGGEQAKAQEQQKPDAFTQADVDRIVKERVQRERAKYADYDDLKAKAEGAKTVEEQLAELKAQNAKTMRDNLASRIAAKHGISPEDADLFLTGNDEESLTAQAERLAERESERKKRNNVVPNEGKTITSTSDPKREWLRSLKE